MLTTLSSSCASLDSPQSFATLSEGASRVTNGPQSESGSIVNQLLFSLCAWLTCSSHSPESVTCARCSRVFHLTCVDPPLAMKPKAGYAWSCAPCSKAHEDQVESFIVKGVAPSKNPSDKRVVVPVVEAAEGKGKARAKGKRLSNPVLLCGGLILRDLQGRRSHRTRIPIRESGE